MEAWQITLIVLGCIALTLAIFALCYMIIYFRKAGIVAKKIDYLVEDWTFKSEQISSTIEAINKIAAYVDLIEGFINQNTESISKYIANNKESTYKFVSKLKEIVKEK